MGDEKRYLDVEGIRQWCGAYSTVDGFDRRLEEVLIRAARPVPTPKFCEAMMHDPVGCCASCCSVCDDEDQYDESNCPSCYPTGPVE